MRQPSEHDKAAYCVGVAASVTPPTAGSLASERANIRAGKSHCQEFGLIFAMVEQTRLLWELGHNQFPTSIAVAGPATAAWTVDGQGI